MREDFYQAIKGYKQEAEKDGSFKKLDNEHRRYVEKILKDFETGGLKLSEQDRKKMVEM